MRKMSTWSTSFSNRPSSYQKLSYNQKLSQTNRKLRVGDVSEVANRTGYSSQHVSDVLTGKYENTRILNKAYDMTRGRKSNMNIVSSII